MPPCLPVSLSDRLRRTRTSGQARSVLFPRSLRASLVLSLLCVACSSNDDGGSTTPASSAFTAHFQLAEGGTADIVAVPFPSDLLVDATGAIKLDPSKGALQLVPKEKGAQLLTDALAVTRGFGVVGGALFALDNGAPDPTKLPQGKPGDCQGKDSPVYLVDLDAGQLVDCQAQWNDDNLLNRDIETTPMLNVRAARGIVLPEKHKIAVLLTDGLVDKQGVKLAAAPDFVALRDGARTDAAGKLYGPAVTAAAEKIGIDKKRVVAAAVYTTGAVSDELRQMHALAVAAPAPTLRWAEADVAPVKPVRFTSTSPLPTGWTATLDDWLGTPKKLATGSDDPDWSSSEGIAHDALGSVGVASFDSPYFLIDAGGYGDPKHATVYRGADGKVAQSTSKATSKIWVSVFLPKTPAPAGGYPVVVFQHGMGGQRGDALALANVFAQQGWATVAIEAVLQGTRGLDSGARGDSKNDYKRASAKYEGPDGFSDKASDGSNYSSNDLFGGLFRLAAMRDQFRQAAVDHAVLLRLLKTSPVLDGLALDGKSPKIDGTKVAYFGISLGGLIGSLLAGIEPGHAAYVLQVPGGGILAELATNSPFIYGLLNGSAALNFGFRNTQSPAWHPMVQLMQHVMDGGDPLAVANTVVTNTKQPRNVLMFEVIADEIVPNTSTEALARAMGIKLIDPHGATVAKLETVDGKSVSGVPTKDSTAVLVQLYPAEHGSHCLSRKGSRDWRLDGPVFGDNSRDPFEKRAKPEEFENPYLEVQQTSMSFIAQAFDAKVPTVTWTKAPVTPKD